MINAVRPRQNQNLEELLRDIQETCVGRIEDVSVFKQGNNHAGTKAIFKGTDGGREVILATVGRNLRGVGEKVANSGYGLENEVKIGKDFGLVEAYENHLAIANETFETNGGELVAVSPRIEGVCLADYVSTNKFNQKDFRTFFGQAISTQKFMKEKDVCHRDLSPYNLLVKKNGTMEAWTTDLGSACKTAEARAETLHTRGARTVRDPRLFFNNSTYSDRQEVYALAQNMLVALNGEPAVKYDSCNFKDWNSKLHDKKIKQAVKKMPRWARKRYKKLIYKAMSSEGGCSIEEFQRDFQKVSRVGILETTKRKVLAGTLAGAITLAGLGINEASNHYQNNLEQAVNQASLYPVTTNHLGENTEIINNLIGLDLRISTKPGYERLYSKNKTPEFIKLKQGQTIRVLPYLEEKPRPEIAHLALPSFKVRVYFEGYPAKEFHTPSICSDPYVYEMGGPIPREEDITVPKEMRDGCYQLVTEVYAHTKKNKVNMHDATEGMIYESPGRAIIRKPINVVVGDPKDYLFVNYFRGEYSPSIDLRNLRKVPREQDPNFTSTKRVEEGTTAEASFPGMGYNPGQKEIRGLGDHFQWARFPKMTDTKEKIMQVVTRQDGKVTGYQYIPVKGEKIGNSYWMQASRPGPDFSDKIVELRKQLYEESGD